MESPPQGSEAHLILIVGGLLTLFSLAMWYAGMPGTVLLPATIAMAVCTFLGVGQEYVPPSIDHTWWDCFAWTGLGVSSIIYFVDILSQGAPQIISLIAGVYAIWKAYKACKEDGWPASYKKGIYLGVVVPIVIIAVMYVLL